MSNSILDSREKMLELDPNGAALLTLEMLGSQIQACWQLASEITFPDSYRDITNVVVAGMGGSVLGTHIIQTLFKDELRVPIIIAPDYTVPSFVNEHTLVVCSSYSGSTEETLAAAQDAIAKGAKITGITSGGKLAEMLRAGKYPALIFDPEFNPSKAPRMGLGYSLFGQMALFARAGLITIDQSEYQAIMDTVADAQLRFSANVTQEKNPAKLLAFELLNKLPIILAAEHLEGVAHVFANQLNENAKTFSEYRIIPEMNHHLLEGFQFPDTNPGSLLAVSLHSSSYMKSNQRRMELTEELLEKHEIEFRQYVCTRSTKVEQMFEVLVFAAYTAFYLAMLNHVNPTPLPEVDWLKAELKKSI